MYFRTLLVIIAVLAGCVFLRTSGQAGFGLSTFHLHDINQVSPANETSGNTTTDLPGPGGASGLGNTTPIATQQLPKANESSPKSTESLPNITADLQAQTNASSPNITTDLPKPNVSEQVNETLANATVLPQSIVSQELNVSSANITDLPIINISEPLPNVTSSNITVPPIIANVTPTNIIIPPAVTLPQQPNASSSNVTVPPPPPAAPAAPATPSNQTSVRIKLRCDKTGKEKEVIAGVGKDEPKMTLTVNGSVIFSKENANQTIQLPTPRQTQTVKEEGGQGQGKGEG